MRSQVTKHHIQQIDYIRAFASLAVALFHMGGKTLPILNYGWLGVDMFFLLSGFTICWSIPSNYNLKKAGKFITKRILRIEPPYIISIVLAIVSHYIFTKNYIPDWTNVLFHLAYINTFLNYPTLNPVYWTLAIEFQFYIFIALFFPILIKKWSPALLVILCVATIWITPSVTTLITVFPLFAIGIIYFLYKKQHLQLKEALIYGAVITGVSFFKVGLAQTVAAIVALIILTLPLKSNRIVSFFSKISFSLYLTHDIIGSSLVVYLGTKLPKTVFFKGIEFLTGIVVSIVFAYLFYKLIEEPSLRFSKRISYSPPSNSSVSAMAPASLPVQN